MALHMYDTDGLVPPVAKRARIDYNTNYEQQAAVRTTTHPILLPPQLVDIQLNKDEQEMFTKSVEAVKGLVEACKGIDSSLA